MLLLRAAAAATRCPSSTLTQLQPCIAAAVRYLSATAAVQSEQEQQQPREQMKFDLLIVGAGPAGLSAAIRFKQVNITSHGDQLHGTVIVSVSDV